MSTQSTPTTAIDGYFEHVKTYIKTDAVIVPINRNLARFRSRILRNLKQR